MTDTRPTVGEALITLLERHGVDTVFGIPGVHTAELYRGLAASPIRHVTPRHEQGAGFMADGYARVTGRPGVAFVITGPGLTNTITAMAQAREDSIPMLVISGVNARATLGRGQGCLHELPDQAGMMRTFAKDSITLMDGADLPAAIDRAFVGLATGRPGPVHLEIPTDVMTQRIDLPDAPVAALPVVQAGAGDMAAARAMLGKARAPVILAGGGAVRAGAELTALAEALDAPVVLTANARGLLHDHPLAVPASPSRAEVRRLIATADVVLAVGTQFGPTDYDIDVDGGFPDLPALIRIERDAVQMARGPRPAVALLSGAAEALAALAEGVAPAASGGAGRAADTRAAAWAGLSDKVREEVGILNVLRDAIPGVRFVGDSTQLVYAGNYYCEPGAPGLWFNSATGYGALGYGPAAAVGAALGAPGPVVCLTGDGGLQFSLAELGTARDEGLPILFLVWNNHGYREIETYMRAAGIAPEGVTPSPPDFRLQAEAYGLRYLRADDAAALDATVRGMGPLKGPVLLEMRRP
ncbi:5-guanidino-2-oxopentanoate decarboxylase [Pseudooceanicola sp. LIPI14-2-Ac024]|uniref:5-guanidino-2-oxopentanoate decarboxylase n=1 Tax=Pseudooceanicola sp. LIPI14-2-Ac024 TaxID=3344875 RepID=UPI0035CF6371